MIYILIYGLGTLLTTLGYSIAQTVSLRRCIRRQLVKVTSTNVDVIKQALERATHNWNNAHAKPALLFGLVWPVMILLLIVSKIGDFSTGRNIFACDGLLEDEAVAVIAQEVKAAETKKEEIEQRKLTKKQLDQTLRESV